MTDQTTETRVAEIEKRAVDALGIGAFGKAVLVCRSDIPWLTAQLRAAWKREAALRAAMKIASEWAERVSLGTDATPRIVGAMALIQAATKEANNE